MARDDRGVTKSSRGVNGAQSAADTALTTASAEMLWRNGWSAAVTADAQLSNTMHSYSGKGIVRYNW
jgi:hypothetical protein